MGKVAEAETALGKALGIEPQNIDYMYALIDFYVRRGRIDAALELAEQMIATYPDNPLGHNIKASIERR
jgi:pentatricopeptide repeat protein